ncbi:hypothetical protein GCM10009841_09010 [Microlunatus panaciterrae]
MTRFESELRQAHRPRSAAELRSAGVSRGSTRGRAWRSTSRGYFAPALDPVVGLTTTQRILDAYPLVTERGAIGGWAAAFIQGVDLLDGRDPWTMRPEPVQICLGADLGRQSTDKIRYSRDELPGDQVVERCGIRVTRPFRTALDGARLARDLVEAVVFLDAMSKAGTVELSDLARYIGTAARQRWITRARRAVVLADPNTLSTWESRLRLFYLLQAGLPKPLVNQPLFDLRGNLVGVPDLLDLEAGLVTEFDGQGHRLRDQHNRDNVREEKFEALGLVVTRADSLDLRRHRAELRQRLRAAHRRGLQRDRSRDRWTIRPPEWWDDPWDSLTAADKTALLG